MVGYKTNSWWGFVGWSVSCPRIDDGPTVCLWYLLKFRRPSPLVAGIDLPIVVVGGNDIVMEIDIWRTTSLSDWTTTAGKMFLWDIMRWKQYYLYHWLTCNCCHPAQIGLFQVVQRRLFKTQKPKSSDSSVKSLLNMISSVSIPVIDDINLSIHSCVSIIFLVCDFVTFLLKSKQTTRYSVGPLSIAWSSCATY